MLNIIEELDSKTQKDIQTNLNASTDSLRGYMVRVLKRLAQEPQHTEAFVHQLIEFHERVMRNRKASEILDSLIAHREQEEST